MFTGNVQVVAGPLESLDALIEHLEREGIRIRGNRDAYARAYHIFGIDEARELRARAAGRSYEEGGRIFVVAATTMTNEAQNALLKTIEEEKNAAFFFLVPAPDMLLPTLRSRMQRYDIEVERGAQPDAQHFLRSTPAQRLDMLKPLLKSGEDEARDLGAILRFLASLERALVDRPNDVRAVYRARSYITDRGALVKPLLEQVALLVASRPTGVSSGGRE